MSGVYIHIPFCTKKCIYCDFYSVALASYSLPVYVDCVLREFDARVSELGDSPIKTIYVGGGTPSLVPVNLLSNIVSHVNFGNHAEEITVEVNPDDVTGEFAVALAASGINRVSIGVQSFSDEELKFLNRRHDSEKAIFAIRMLQDAGIQNLSVDLIYGIPGQTLETWGASVDAVLALNVQHVSAYNLMYEEGTRLFFLRERGRVEECGDSLCLSMFDLLVEKLGKAGFEQYEISNFAKEGMYSMHNSSYWKFIPYLGLGASAHSFDGKIRRYNPSNVKRYLAAIAEGKVAFEEEHEAENELYNEWIMTRLRTMWGVDLQCLKSRFGDRYYKHALPIVDGFFRNGYVTVEEGVVRLTKKGIMMSDMVFRELFVVD